MDTWFRHAVGRGVVAVALTLSVWRPAMASPLLVNGGFESGFAGWVRVDQAGGLGTFQLQTGTTSPVVGDVVPLPTQGSTAAMSDSEGPGTHVLYQDFLVPALTGNATLSFDLFIGNRNADFFLPIPPSLDYGSTQRNQQSRVDILRAGSDPFSLSSADVLATFYQTISGDPLISGYDSYTFDVTSLLAAQAGQRLRLRFAEADNVFTFQLGIDNVNLDVQAVPEPGSLGLLALGLGAMSVRRRRPSER